MKRFFCWLALAALALSLTLAGGYGQTKQPPMTKEQKIQNALGAAPAGIAKDATVVDLPATPGGAMPELKKGTNAWTCMPDNPANPANDPMCLDKVALQWADAWMHKKPVNITSMGIAYMLQGGATADNDDPSAEKPKAGKNWLMEPPHLMIFGVKLPPGIYTSQANTTQPWIMWNGTPYEHLMVPVK